VTVDVRNYVNVHRWTVDGGQLVEAEALLVGAGLGRQRVTTRSQVPSMAHIRSRL
jgi:hypothetical protein